MRKHTITDTELVHIEIIRRRASRALTNEVFGFIPADETKHVHLVANNREMLAIIEHVRRGEGYVATMVAPEYIISRIIALALLRTGQPGYRGQSDTQPSFNELPVIA